MEKTLRDLILQLFIIFGTQNAKHIPSISNRLDFLALAVRNLEDGIVEMEVGRYPKLLASVFARICSVIEYYPEMDWVKMLAEKYPATGCTYCDKPSCGCEETKRGVEGKGAASEEQLLWSLWSFQTHLAKIYGAKNKEKGIDFALHRLLSEVVELRSFYFRHMGKVHDSDFIRAHIGNELADVLAWTIAIANILEINLEKVVLDQYQNGCSSCGHNICDCGGMIFKTAGNRAIEAHTVVD